MNRSKERSALSKELDSLDHLQLRGVLWECIGALTVGRDLEAIYKLVRTMIPKEPPNGL